MSRYVINVLASRDLNEIADYFSETSLNVGERFFANLTESANNLLPSPAVAGVMQTFALVCEEYP